MPRSDSPSDLRRELARRVADAHRGIDDASLLAYVSGSVVEDLADARSDVDLSVVLRALPDEAVLRAACARAGGEPWFWSAGTVSEGLVVAFRLDGIEVQIAYVDEATLTGQLDQLLVAHDPDTPLHKLGEGLLKAEPLVGAERLLALQARLAAFPPELGRAMITFWATSNPTPWRALPQILHRDAGLWCRELVVEGCWRQLGMLAGLNRRWFTRFQLKRTSRLAASMTLAPPRLAERIDALLEAPPAAAFAALHALEGEVLDLVATHAPEIDLGAVRARWATFGPG